LRADRTNLQHLVDAHGPQGREALLDLLGVLSICRVPGVGGIAGVAILALATSSWQRSGHADLLSRFGAFEVTRTWAIRLLGALACVYERASQFHRPKWPVLADAISRRCMAVGVGCVGALIVLPLPLGNLLPGLALAFAGIGMMRRNGVALMLAAARGLLGTAWPIALARLSMSSLDGLAAITTRT
jgi:hypothetical protein